MRNEGAAESRKPWTPEIQMDQEFIWKVLQKTFPDLHLASLELIGKGWDNHAFLVNHSLIFRVPHRSLAAELMETEVQLLAELSRRSLPLRIPELVYSSPPSAAFPYPIAGYPLLSGTTADRANLSPDERLGSATALGKFLNVLHRSEPVASLPGDKIRRADMRYRLPRLLDMSSASPPEVHRLLIQLAEAPPYDGPPVWLHGDLYARHLIVGSDRRLTAIIDWGDTHGGDPALDLSIAWAFLPGAARPPFLAAYGGVDGATWQRARFRALSSWVMLSRYSEDQGDVPLARECEVILKNVLEA